MRILYVFFLCSLKFTVVNAQKFKQVNFNILSIDTDKGSLQIEFCNNTNQNIFFTFSTTSEYDSQNGLIPEELQKNQTLHKKIYTKDKEFYNEAYFAFPNIKYSSTRIRDSLESVFEKKRLLYLAEIYNLNKVVYLKKRESKLVIMPLNLFFNDRRHYFFYRFIKGEKYTIQFEYCMNKAIFEKYTNPTKVDSLKKDGFVPYFEKIISNRCYLKTDNIKIPDEDYWFD
jgi:hypothetical protein